MDLFKKSLLLAKESGAKFNGVLCGRATWKDSIEPFAKDGIDACENFLNEECKKNISSLNEVLNVSATSFKYKLDLSE